MLKEIRYLCPDVMCGFTIDRVLIRHQQHVSRASRSIIPSLTAFPLCASFSFFFFFAVDASSVQQSNLNQYFLLLYIDPKWDNDFKYGKK